MDDLSIHGPRPASPSDERPGSAADSRRRPRRRAPARQPDKSEKKTAEAPPANPDPDDGDQGPRSIDLLA